MWMFGAVSVQSISLMNQFSDERRLLCQSPSGCRKDCFVRTDRPTSTESVFTLSRQDAQDEHETKEKEQDAGDSGYGMDEDLTDRKIVVLPSGHERIQNYIERANRRCCCSWIATMIRIRNMATATTAVKASTCIDKTCGGR